MSNLLLYNINKINEIRFINCKTMINKIRFINSKTKKCKKFMGVFGLRSEFKGKWVNEFEGIQI